MGVQIHTKFALVSSERYINTRPQKGALLLNVSLRDFDESIYTYVKDSIFVDDWEEVCRENTDIEMLSKTHGLKKEDTYAITDLLKDHPFEKISPKFPIMFNPMGMAVFDIAIAKYYAEKAKEGNLGHSLTDI